MGNRAGLTVTQLSGASKYQSFLPTPLQDVKLEDMGGDFQSLLANTSRLIGRLDGISSSIPDIDLFISMYVRKEALLSSQIEGTQATLDDILDPEAETNQNVNVSEVLNYIKATDYAMERMKELPLCLRLLKETHEILLSGIRGSEKSPGEFRRSQNWIGPAGSTL
jgi:Fic family protein